MEELAGRYRIEEAVGQGGMATVYLARDLKHGREVAVKVIRPELAEAVGAERFLREIEITASLNHPHILPLLDSGESGGRLYYVMPWVAGGSLRRLLSSGADLPLEAVLRVVEEVASALDYAHGRGVVHRDIKPENILFNEGLAVVADFGIARAVQSTPRERMTRTGLALGTLGYMSPEQALGTAELDARSDVYSLGCVIYEMLIGETPASWPGPEDVRLGRMSDLPDAHRRRLDGYPGRIEQVLAKALALRAGDRFGRAGELARALVAASERTPSFTDEEVRRLLDRAAELQAQEEDREEEGLTMGAVEQVAAQVGIPPEHVRRAAEELGVGGEGPRRPGQGVARPAEGPAPPPAEGPPPPPAEGPPRADRTLVKTRPHRGMRAWHEGRHPSGEGLWRRPGRERWDRVVVESTVEGEVPESAYPDMVEEIQERLGVVGHASVLAGSLTWSPATHGEGTRNLVVSVRRREGETVVRVEERFELRGFRRAFVGVGALSGALMAAFIGSVGGVADSAMPGIVLPFVLLGVAGGVFGTVRFEANTRRGELEGLGERLSEMARAALEKGGEKEG